MGINACPIQVKLDIPADLTFLALVSESLRSVFEHVPGLPDKEAVLYNLQLAAQEACTNIIQHAYGLAAQPGLASPGMRIALEICLDSTTITIQLEDTGRPFDGLPEPGVVQVPDEPQEHGYGLFLIYALVDEVRYQALPGKNCWVLSKQFGAPGEPAASVGA